MVPAGPFHYPEDQMSDAPMRHLAAEITREKIYRQLHQELPYQSTVETDSWTERKDKLGPHRADDLCRAREPAQDRARQGRRHHQVDRRGFAQGDRRDRRRQPVHLFLFVKVRENWGDDPERYREMGLEFPEGISESG